MIIGSFQELVRDCVLYLKEVLHCIYAFELWADKADLTLENWYELASNIPGHNATVFEMCQLEIYEISAFLKATRKFACLAFVFLHETCVVVGVHLLQT